MMNKPLLILALAGSFTLAACSGEQNAADADNTPAVEDEVVAPLPMIGKSDIYRCADSSIVYADYFTDKVSVNVRLGADALPVKLVAPAEGESFVAEGYSLTVTDENIDFTSPEKSNQICKS